MMKALLLFAVIFALLSAGCGDLNPAQPSVTVQPTTAAQTQRFAPAVPSERIQLNGSLVNILD